MPTRPHKPTTKTRMHVEELAGYGVPHPQIAKHIGVSRPTLTKHYREQLDIGLAIVNSRVAGALFKAAQDGNVTAAIFWLKTRAGWSDRPGSVKIAEIPAKDDEEISPASDREVARRIAFLFDRAAERR